MAYDFVVGWRSKRPGSSEHVGAIDYRDMTALAALMLRSDSFFLGRLTDIYQDQSFSNGEVRQALTQLLPLMCEQLSPDERALLDKLIAVLCFAGQKEDGLHALAD
ncbi:hypothetical protein F2P45_04500 [Massilia sp. CCM 8733]|uniref:Uncharacterized protein n=1 Tax=Massilia mucilaginosa TaxID=2609282 RepID=A0ABX0NNB2_9BURK|nr:hypothetical protein [Massilia mucilaginosa]NHZ88289.1 hypothetical protein [Massilia mucilaginosa]